MSKDIIVLTPNGRRQKVHCTPDTIILQVLEDVCQKQGFQATEYALKHHNHVLDLTSTIRFSNLPNKATLEMVEAERRREETTVTIGLLLEDGERRTADFPPNTCLYDLITSLAPTELHSLQHPMIMYMRQEVVGVPALQGKTLRQLGLMGGRAILRLLNKAGEAKQANVSTVYRRPNSVSPISDTKPQMLPPANANDFAMPGPSNAPIGSNKFDPMNFIIAEKRGPTPELKVEPPIEEPSESAKKCAGEVVGKRFATEDTDCIVNKTTSSQSLVTQEALERRLRIEEEVNFLGAQKAVAFLQPENSEEQIDDLPDDFYELTIEEVRKLYKDLQQNRLELENSPLLTTSQRQELETQTSQQRLASYKNVVVRIQFPDHIILQGVFSPNDTIENVFNFIKEHLQTPEKPFHVYTPLKQALDPKMTLLEARFVPCVHMHFKWLTKEEGLAYLKEEVYRKRSSSDAATILASKYRAPSRRKIDEGSDNSQKSGTSSKATSSKVPKWFKT